MIGFYDSFSLPDEVLNIPREDKHAFWEAVARKAVDHFPTKNHYTHWVHGQFASDENRMLAAGYWDLVVFERDETITEEGVQ